MSAVPRLLAADRQTAPVAVDWAGYLVWRLRRFGVPGIVGVAALVTCAVGYRGYYVPQRAAVAVLQHRVVTLEGLAREHGERALAASPERAIEALPTRADVPALLGTILEQAHAAGVVLDRGNYDLALVRGGRIARYQLAFPLKAAYPQLRRFIDGTIDAAPALALDVLRFERKTIAETVLEADVRFVVFARNAP
ncbi:MAG: hypothetical protein HY749_14845 [Gammaproteobacteria bacterium]|nr:hypothetical protein [Gammaproteobacteria bacterium]MBI5614883.1 hypothetical protein [Gammaproteobacteria bacterium]